MTTRRTSPAPEIDAAPRRQRGRPRRYDADAARRAIAAQFRSAGYEATSLDDISAVTGMRRPSLYLAFGDKQAMYLACLKAPPSRSPWPKSSAARHRSVWCCGACFAGCSRSTARAPAPRDA
ncbi:helix-turn-helix transcriptional regulator [Bradyrhizobium sp. Pear76]|uniref:TetR/AcrR family transcriptional regulator n=1 Tax=Bradyrhizobium oropedii TaxID=1571201 RepID=UPI003B84688C|nr:helix-turn-helix transcriptional regulator [Bradyrhizobium oropedii]